MDSSVKLFGLRDDDGIKLMPTNSLGVALRTNECIGYYLNSLLNNITCSFYNRRHLGGIS